MYMLVNCSGCRTPLQLPPGAGSIRCAICQAITQVAGSRAAPPPPNQYHPPPPPNQYHPPPPNPHAPPVPSPYSHAPRGPPPSPHGRKKAVICGISYKFTNHELKGCINDAKCMRHLLINKFQFPSESILMLTEEESDPTRTPTRHTIRMAMYWLVTGCQPGDSLVFHYSGHGSRQRDRSGEELDGYDETLCPVDFETQGMIVDDEVNLALVRPLPRGVKLHAIVDACHSGTILDLPFLCRMNRNGQYVWEDHRPRTGTWKGSNGGEVISISGCDDDQTSADTAALSQVTSTGAMTYCFIQAIERGEASTYGSMLNSMRSAIRNVGNGSGGGGGGLGDILGGGGAVTSLLNMLVSGGSVSSGGLTQEPQLTACEPFDVYMKPFSL